MGYSSSVVFAMNTKVFNALKLLDMVPPQLLKDTHYSVGDATYWVFQDVKWYHSFEGVQAYTQFMEFLDFDESITTICNAVADRGGKRSVYGFMRIGEDQGDYEEQGDPWDFDIELVRYIDVPMPSTPTNT